MLPCSPCRHPCWIGPRRRLLPLLLLLRHKQSPRASEMRASALGYGTYDDVINNIENAVTPGPYILGDRFSAADVYFGSQLAWGLMIKSIEPRPTITEYVARLSKRPAYQRFMAKTKELEDALKKKAG